MKMTEPSNDTLVPLGRVSKFIRQLTHDVRNGLSAIDLESAFIAELVTDPEASDEVRKLRNMISNTAKMLKEVSQNFQPVTLHPMAWEAATFVEELQNRLRKQFPEEENWAIDSRLDHERVSIDLEQMVIAVVQVLRNAFQFRMENAPLRLVALSRDDRVVLEIHEPKRDFDNQVPPEQWGGEPLRTTRAGGYGLGLYRAREIMEAHTGQLEAHYEGRELVTRMTLPLCDESVE